MEHCYGDQIFNTEKKSVRNICVANVGVYIHYIGGDYRFTSDIVLFVQVSNGRRVVMVNSWVYVMTADNHVSRGSPLIGAVRQLDQPRGSRSRGDRLWQ